MFDILLNAAKFIVSDDVRKSTSAIVDLIRRSPEWQKDICTLEASINKTYFEQAMLLSDLATSKMQNLNFANEGITAFRVIFLELVRNAFEHGCKNDKDAIKIILEITQTYVGLSVVNPAKRKFNIETTSKVNQSLLDDNPNLLRGRGLLLVQELADSVQMTENRTGVKAVVYAQRVSLEVLTFGGLMILNIKAGLYNPYISKHIIKEVAKYPDYDVIINLSGLGIDTDITKTVIQLGSVKARDNQQVLALLRRGAEGKIFIPREILAYSLQEALAKLNRLDLLLTLENKIIHPHYLNGNPWDDDYVEKPPKQIPANDENSTSTNTSDDVW